MPAGVLDEAPGVRRLVQAMDVLITRPEQPRAGDLHQGSARVLGHEMQHRRHAGLARHHEQFGIEADAEREGQQLVFGAEIGPLNPPNVLRILIRGSGAAGVGVHSADAGLLQRANAGVAVLRRVADLGQIDDRGRPHVNQAERRRQHAGVHLCWRECGREQRLDIAIVVRHQLAVRHDAVEQALISVAVGVDEARNGDPARAIDRRCVRGGDARPDVADFAVLNQYIRRGKITDLTVDGDNRGALDQNAARALQAAQRGIGRILGDALSYAGSGQGGAGKSAGHDAGAGVQQRAARKGCVRRENGAFYRAARAAGITNLGHHSLPRSVGSAACCRSVSRGISRKIPSGASLHRAPRRPCS